MAHLTIDELKHLAKLSGLSFNQNEAAQLSEQIETILNYVDQIKKIDLDNRHLTLKQTDSYLREDTVQQFEHEKILEQAPVVDDNYFAVPQILDEK